MGRAFTDDSGLDMNEKGKRQVGSQCTKIETISSFCPRKDTHIYRLLANILDLTPGLRSDGSAKAQICPQGSGFEVLPPRHGEGRASGLQYEDPRYAAYLHLTSTVHRPLF